MKRIALLNASGLCLSVALWDGVTPWDPVAAGQCAATVDVTADPAVSPGWTDAGGTWTAPAPVIAPDPIGFGLAIFADTTIPIATRLALMPWTKVLADQVGNPALITAAWSALVAQYAISAANQTSIHDYAVAHGIPGI